MLRGNSKTFKLSWHLQ